MSLENRTVVISGATGELGAVLSRDLAAWRVNLALLGRDAEKLDELSKSLSLPEGQVMTVTVDLLDPKQTKAAAGAVVDKFAHVDVLLHLAGGWTGGKSLVETPVADLTFMLSQHVWSSFNVIQAFVPSLVENGWGRVVMISSPSASQPSAKGGAYAAGKAGQEAMMLALAEELKGTGVTANLLLVKTIDTQRKKVSEPGVGNAAWTTPEEISAAMLYLLSEQAGTINGAKIPMYGG
ncbi:MAG: SDR family NAD(P)-dependent oxidoreductase [Anaerolineales bacterium]|nr:SDR family NAD(P)-dependent oxidoreductase [Anaerolineales bacterium]